MERNSSYRTKISSRIMFFATALVLGILFLRWLMDSTTDFQQGIRIPTERIPLLVLSPLTCILLVLETRIGVRFRESCLVLRRLAWNHRIPYTKIVGVELRVKKSGYSIPREIVIEVTKADRTNRKYRVLDSRYEPASFQRFVDELALRNPALETDRERVTTQLGD
jgi:hypothetical protein